MNNGNPDQTNDNKNILDDIILEVLATIFVVGIIVACCLIIA
jgi:hypothetical protein